MRTLLTLALLAVTTRVAASPDRDPDTEVASREFQNGSALYAEEHYAEAITHFERARALRPLPAFDYNIARCYDRMGDWARAVERYRSFLAAQPADADAAVTRRRIAQLESRIQAPPPPALTIQAPPPLAPRPPLRARTVAGATVGAFGVASLAAGITFGVLTQQASNDISNLDRNHLTFDSARYQGGQTYQVLEGSLIGVGAAAVVVGIVVLATRRLPQRGF
jgi:tetratricopeptide (TPR) repeat protein